jgi:hypothetical protein
MAQTAIASDRSYEVFQMRRLKGELGAQSFDSSHRRLNRVSGYRAFLADVDDSGDACNPNPRVTAAVTSGHESDTE